MLCLVTQRQLCQNLSSPGILHAHLIEAADGEDILVVKSGLVVDPLPHLSAPNFCSGSVLHEVVQGHTAHASQPCL